MTTVVGFIVLVFLLLIAMEKGLDGILGKTILLFFVFSFIWAMFTYAVGSDFKILPTADIGSQSQSR